MKRLVVFYSLEGHCKKVAEQIKNLAQADILELKVVDEKERKGFAKYFWGGRQVVMNMKPAIKDIEININDYDTIIFGTPVWASRYAPAIHTFISQYPIQNKQIGLFCTCQGGKGKTFEKFKEKLKGNLFLGELVVLDRNMDNEPLVVESIQQFWKDCEANEKKK